MKYFPKETDVIYTANAYQSDEAFKFWAAEKCQSGSKLFIGQHGGTFGLSFFNQTEEHQLNIADTFISWGWNSEFFDNIVSLPSIKLKGNNSIHPSQRNDGNFIKNCKTDKTNKTLKCWRDSHFPTFLTRV